MNPEIMFEQEHRVALFQNMKHGFYSLSELPDYAKGDENWALSDYARLSEWQSVSFKPLPADVVQGTALVALRKAREEVVNKFTGELATIDERIANLLCLPAPEASLPDEVVSP